MKVIGNYVGTRKADFTNYAIIKKTHQESPYECATRVERLLTTHGNAFISKQQWDDIRELITLDVYIYNYLNGLIVKLN